MDEEPDDTNPLVFVVVPFVLLLAIVSVWLLVALMVGGSLLWLPLGLVIGAVGLWTVFWLGSAAGRRS